MATDATLTTTHNLSYNLQNITNIKIFSDFMLKTDCYFDFDFFGFAGFSGFC